MRILRNTFYLVCLIACLCCNKGEWQSVFKIAGEENVTYLNLVEEDKVRIKLKKNGNEIDEIPFGVLSRVK